MLAGRIVRALDSRPEDTTYANSNTVRNILLFLFVSDEYNYFYSSGIPLNKIFIIRRNIYRKIYLDRKLRPIYN